MNPTRAKKESGLIEDSLEALQQGRPRLLANKTELIDKAAKAIRELFSTVPGVAFRDLRLSKIVPSHVASTGLMVAGCTSWSVRMVAIANKRSRQIELAIPIIAGEPVLPKTFISSAGLEFSLTRESVLRFLNADKVPYRSKKRGKSRLSIAG